MLRKKAQKDQKVSETVQKVKVVAVPKVMMILAAIFLVTWTLIGLSILTLLVQGQRKGTFSGLTAPAAQRQIQTPQVPTETVIPGVGKVNVGCVQGALSPEAIQKILQEGNTSTLTNQEKVKLEPCIAEKEEATPSPR